MIMSETEVNARFQKYVGDARALFQEVHGRPIRSVEEFETWLGSAEGRELVARRVRLNNS
jgi:hypothetical protein